MTAPVVLFGGTFDPPHVGHLLMAQLAHEQLGGAEVWFLPAPMPPHKLGSPPVAPYERRVRMVETLISGYPGMRVCTVESQLPQPSYTVDTVAALQGMYPGVSFVFLIGADSLASLDTWRDAPRLTQMVSFVVALRSGYPFAETYERMRTKLPGLRAHALEMPLIDVSSTWIRERAERGLPLCGLVPDRVLEVWRETT